MSRLHHNVIGVPLEYAGDRRRNRADPQTNAPHQRQSKFEWACMNSTIRVTNSWWEMGVRQCAPLGK